MKSLLHQDYDNFEIVFYDDASTDESHLKIPVDDPRLTLVRNTERQYALYITHDFLTKHCEPNDIAVLVNGNDWLACDDALTKINALYERYDCWVLYGQYRSSSTGRYGDSLPFPDLESFHDLRDAGRHTSHIQTFRAGVYQKIEKQAPHFECLKNEEGRWYQATHDLAALYPVMDLAGFDRVCFNDEVLYANNDECSSREIQNNEAHIRNRRPCRQIDSFQSPKPARKESIR